MTPAFPTDAPIQRLSTDILWYIIKMNADMFADDTAMETTLYTSHVCRSWRTFMLNMPSIWAHLIDLDYLHRHDDKWSHEFFRRSGTALLWIRSRKYAIHSPTDHTFCLEYVLDVIGAYWSRIQKLEATVEASHMNPAQWAPLYLPAPHLESLSLSISRGISNVIITPVLFHFRSNAPMLRHLHLKGFTANITAPWLHHLHSLDLNAHLTVFGILGILKVAKNLVNLRLNYMVARHTTSPLPFAALPKLTHPVLRIPIDLTLCTTLLDHIHIPPACSLHISGHLTKPEDILDNGTPGPVIQTICTRARLYFSYHKPTKISLEYSPSSFVFEDQTHPDKFGFRFRIGSSTKQVFPLQALDIFLGEISQLNFCEVTEVKLLSNNVDHPIEKLAAFVACLSSVNIVEADEWALRHLIRVQEALKTAATGPSIVFPMLSTLKLHSILASSLDGISDPVSEFIRARIALGDVMYRTGTLATPHQI